MTEPAIGKGKAGPGRPKGTTNKSTAQIKEMVVQALDKAGGVNYLVKQAKENPKAFLSLVGRVLPLQVTGAGPNGEHIVRTAAALTDDELAAIAAGESCS